MKNKAWFQNISRSLFRNWKRDLAVFLITGVVFFGLTYFSNTVLAAFSVTSVRPSAAMNPILGIAFGWPAALGCTVANFISDQIAGYAPFVCWVGLLSQTAYGILPYYLWKLYNRSASHKTRLDSPLKTIVFAILMVVDTIFVGLCVGGYQYYTTHSGFWITSWFVFLNDFDMCMIFGLPLMAFCDHLYSRYEHKGRRKLSLNERIILFAAAIEALSLFVIAAISLLTKTDIAFEDQWAGIFSQTSYVINILLFLSVAAMYIVNGLKRKYAGLRIFEKKNGTIYADEKKHLEFVSFPRSAPSNRIKSDALGYSLEDVQKVIMPSYETSWTISLSNQRGCSMKCLFCDCPACGYYGNATLEDFRYQLDTILGNSGGTKTKRMEVEFSRMGEPTFNRDLLTYIEFELRSQIAEKVQAEAVIPVISTMMPKMHGKINAYLKDYCRIKNEVYDGNAQLQISINTTDDNARDRMFHSLSMTLDEIAKEVADLPMPKGIKYELSFAVSAETVIDAKRIDSLFDKNKFCIKLTPIHGTFNAKDNGYTDAKEYGDFSAFEKIENTFLPLGWDVLTYVDRKTEDDDALTNGNLLLANINERIGTKPSGKRRIGIIVAIELDAIFKLYPKWKKLDAPQGYHLIYVDQGDYEIYILRTGMGTIAASAGVQYLCTRFNVASIVNFGVVGGLTTDMKQLKVCLVDQVVHYKYDCSEFMPLSIGQVDEHDSIYLKTSEALVKSALSVMPDLSVVTCCSGDKFVGTMEEKQFLHSTFGGDICDMESAGIVLSCELNKVPCVMLKAVSDGLADGAEGFYKELQNASLRCLEVANKVMDKIAMTES